MKNIQHLLLKQRELYEEIRCKSGGTGLRTDDQETGGTYNIYRCECGRKWHIYENPPICSRFREKYPDELSFLSTIQQEILQAVKEKVEGESRIEFQVWVEKGLWQGEDAQTKNFAVGNVADWWINNIKKYLQ